MSVYAKFKIDSILAFAKSRLQRFSTGNSNGGRSERDSTRTGSDPNQRINFNPYKLFKDKVNQQYFVNDIDAQYMECLFSKWVQNPTSVHTSWQQYFTDVLQSKYVGNVEILPTRQTSTKITSKKDCPCMKSSRSRKAKNREESEDDNEMKPSKKKRGAKKHKPAQIEQQNSERREFDDYGEMMTPFSKPLGGTMQPNPVNRMNTVRYGMESDEYNEMTTPFSKQKSETIRAEKKKRIKKERRNNELHEDDSEMEKPPKKNAKASKRKLVERKQRVSERRDFDDYGEMMTPFSRLKADIVNRMNKVRYSEKSDDYTELVTPFAKLKARMMQPKKVNRMKKGSDGKQSKGDDEIMKPFINPRRQIYEPKPAKITKPKEKEDKNTKTRQEPRYQSQFDSMATDTQSRNQEYMVGHIILSPATEEMAVKSSTMSRQKQARPKPETAKTVAANKTRIDFKKSLQQIKKQRALQRVRAAFKQRPFKGKREFIKSQMERIAKMKKDHMKPKYQK